MKKSRLELSLNVVSIIIVAYFSIPLYTIFSTAFMTRYETYAGSWIPSQPSFENIRIALFEFGMINYVRNSIILTVITTSISLFLCSLVGYALAKFDFPGRGILFILVLIMMMIPPTVLIVPLYILVRDFGWVDTPLAIIVPGALSGFGVFLMRQYTSMIPDSYIDAARIGGYSELSIFLRVILPLSKPALAALAIMQFVYHWNDFFWPFIVLSGETWKTLPVGIQRFEAIYFMAYELKAATALVATIPVIILVIIANRHLLRAMSRLGGIKM